MPIKKTAINRSPLLPGVYIFKNKDKRIIYIGKSVRIRDRVKSYFDNYQILEPKTQKMVGEIAGIDYIVTETELEALILEAALIKQYKPTYNVQWKDDKNYFFIGIKNAKLWREKGLSYVLAHNLWPYVYLTHQTKDETSLFFGPFVSGRQVKQALKVLRKIFGWCEYKKSPQAKNQKGCFYYHLNMCPGVCVGHISLKEYWQNFKHLIWFLSGKKKKIVKELEIKMHQSANSLEFEQAESYKTLINRLNVLINRFHSPNDYLENPNLIDDVYNHQLSDLVKILQFPNQKSLSHIVIEAYDISHLGTQAGVGSRVVFIGGKPDKTKYRRYRLKTAVPDDYQAMAEIIRRRLKKTDDLPDLIVVDGGRGQLSTVKRVLDEVGIQLEVVGLAKKPDRLVIWDKDKQNFRTIGLTDRPALFLLQRLRDEAHRFANTYRKKLLSIHTLSA